MPLPHNRLHYAYHAIHCHPASASSGSAWRTMTGFRHAGLAGDQRDAYPVHCRVDDRAGGKSGGGQMDESLVSGVWAEPSAFLRLLDFVEYSISLPTKSAMELVDADTNLVGDFKMNDVVADFHDGAVDTATGDHAITAL